MELIQLAVLISALLCSLVAGFVLCFAIIVMPGIKSLGVRDFFLILQSNGSNYSEQSAIVYGSLARFSADTCHIHLAGYLATGRRRSRAADFCQRDVPTWRAFTNDDDQHPTQQPAPVSRSRRGNGIRAAGTCRSVSVSLVALEHHSDGGCDTNSLDVACVAPQALTKYRLSAEPSLMVGIPWFGWNRRTSKI